MHLAGQIWPLGYVLKPLFWKNTHEYTVWSLHNIFSNLITLVAINPHPIPKSKGKEFGGTLGRSSRHTSVPRHTGWETLTEFGPVLSSTHEPEEELEPEEEHFMQPNFDNFLDGFYLITINCWFHIYF
jgi:hypothetical protein